MRLQHKTIIVSYSHKDRHWLEELRPHLGSLSKEKGIEPYYWDDTEINPGSKWPVEVSGALRSAKVAILLVSKHFLDSGFITTNELPILLQAAKEGRAVILPIILGPCRYIYHPALSKLQSVNPPSKPLEGMSKVEFETVFVRVTEVVEAVLVPNTRGFQCASKLRRHALRYGMASTQGMYS